MLVDQLLLIGSLLSNKPRRVNESNETNERNKMMMIIVAVFVRRSTTMHVASVLHSSTRIMARCFKIYILKTIHPTLQY